MDYVKRRMNGKDELSYGERCHHQGGQTAHLPLVSLCDSLYSTYSYVRKECIHHLYMDNWLFQLIS